MNYKVIIAEKPSVAASIAKIVGATTPHRSGPTGYLEGGGYRVTWAFGHLVGLQTPEQMGFGKGILPIFPDTWTTKVNGKRDKEGKEQPDEMVERQLKTIESLFGGATQIIVATDAGREGELIFRYIYEHLRCTTPFQRLWISSLTDEAISKGLGEMKDGHAYDALSDAAHARSQADWLVGYNASRALRLFTGYRGNLSLGRVQTPTLGMICTRYEANKNFVPTPFWVIAVDTAKGNVPFSVLNDGKYTTEQQAQEHLQRVLQDGQLRVEDVEKKHSSRRPPLLYDLTSLQRAANGRYGLTADQTLRIAQSLYEKKYLSYPRTGSRYIPEDVFKTIPALLRKLQEYGEIGTHAAALAGKKLCRRSVNDAKVTDHHALLPTGNIPTTLEASEKKIYEMVVGRMVEAFGENYEADVTTVTMVSADVTFKARGSVPTYLGWKAVYGADVKDEEDNKKDEDDAAGALPPLAKGDRLPINNAEVQQKSDKPLPIYTDSTLLAEMETCGKRIDDEELRESMKDVGLGTPATRAATIEVLIARGYVERQGKKLLPTDFGMQVWSMVQGRKIADVATTGEWERRLHLIETGAQQARAFDKDIRAFVEDIIEDLRANSKMLEGAAEPAHACPLCGKMMKSMQYSITCDTATGGCGLKISREVAGKKLPATALAALLQGKPTAVIKGFTSKTGKKFDAALKIDAEARRLAFDIPAPIDTSSLRCPFCGGALTRDAGKVRCDCGFEMWLSSGGVRFSEDQLRTLLGGGSVSLFGMKSKAGRPFNGRFVIDREKKTLIMNFINKK